MAITYDAVANRITITGYSEAAPCNLCDDCYAADVAGGWGVVQKQGSRQFQFDAKLLVGNWSTSTWVQDTNKQIVFSDLCYGSGYIIEVTRYANLTLGKLVDEAKKITSSGCDLRLDVVAYMIGIRSQGNTYIYSTSVYGGKSLGNGTHYLNTLQRFWNSQTSEGAILYKGSPDISLMHAFTNGFGIYGGGGTISQLIVKDCSIGIRYASDCTVSNGEFTNCTNLASPWTNDNDVELIDCVVDNWSFDWRTGTGNTIYRKYTFNLKVLDANQNGIENATVVLKDKDSTELFSLNTDASGEIVEQTVTRGYYQQPTGSTLQESSPHTLIVSKGGYGTYKSVFTIDKPATQPITLKRIAINIDNEVLC